MEHNIVSPVDIESRTSLGIMSGDRVRVTQRVPEKDGKYRFQDFEGIVIARKHGNEPGGTFTVRTSVEGVGVERIFPLYSPNIDRIEILRRAKVRRAKLYFLRDKTVKGIRDKLRRAVEFSRMTVSESEQAKKMEHEKMMAEEKAQKEAEEKAQKEEQAKESVVEKTEVADEKKGDEGSVQTEEKKEGIGL